MENNPITPSEKIVLTADELAAHGAQGKRLILSGNEQQDSNNTLILSRGAEFQKMKDEKNNEKVKVEDSPKIIEKEPNPIQDKKEEAQDTKTEEDKTKEGKKPKVFEVGVVDAKELATAQAKDVADAWRLKKKEEVNPKHGKVWSYLVKKKREFWDHNLANEHYRNKAIARFEQDILASQNLLHAEDASGAAHRKVVGALVERFTGEFSKDMLKDGETVETDNPALNSEIKTLMKEYAGSTEKWAPEAFKAEQDRILKKYDQNYGKKGALYAENLKEVADSIRDSMAHQEDLADLDFEVKVRLGKAKEALNTEAHLTTFEKGVENLSKHKIGQWLFNECTLPTLIGAGLYAGTKAVTTSAATRMIMKWVSLGAMAGTAGSVAAVKEKFRIEREKAQDSRERAKNMTMPEHAKRRNEFQKSTYELRPMTESIAALKNTLERFNAGSIDQSVVTNELAEINARISLGQSKKIDLFKYSSNALTEVERTEMLLARAKLNKALQTRMNLSDEAFKAEMDRKTSNFSKELIEGEGGIEAQDKKFRKMKRVKVGTAFVVGATVGAVAGTVVQEGVSVVKSGLSYLGVGEGQDGVISGLFKGIRNMFNHTPGAGYDKSTNAAGGLIRKLFEHSPRIPMAGGHEFVSGPIHFRLPEGVSLHPNGDGSYAIFRGNDVVPGAGHVKLDDLASGNSRLADPVRQALQKADIFTSAGPSTPETSMGVRDYIKSHPGETHVVHRTSFEDNGTPRIYEKGELKLDWGGPNHTGISADGKNYVLTIRDMKAGDSYHMVHGEKVYTNVPKGVAEGKMTLELSADAADQHHTFHVTFDKDGNAYIPTNSTIAHTGFSQHIGHDGHMHASDHLRYTEAAYNQGVAHDGGQKIDVVATYEGHGVKNIITPGSHVIRLDVPDVTTTESPWFIPGKTRKPLEAAEEKAAAVLDSRAPIAEGVPLAAVKKTEEGTVKTEEAVEKQVLNEISKAEYDAYNDDVKLLNKTIQNHKGIIELQRDQLKSERGRQLYDQYKHIGPGKPVTFNKEELRKIADDLEGILVKSKVKESANEKQKADIVEKMIIGMPLNAAEKTIYAANQAEIVAIIRAKLKEEGETDPKKEGGKKAQIKPDSNVVELGKFDDSKDLFEGIAKKIANGEKATAAEKAMYAEHEDEINALVMGILEKKGTAAPAPAPVSVTVTKELYEKFLKTNEVPHEVLVSMAEKMKAGGGQAALTGEEKHIYYKKAAQVEDILTALKKAEEKNTTEPKNPDTKKNTVTPGIEQAVLLHIAQKIKEKGADSLTKDEKEAYNQNRNAVEYLMKDKAPAEEKIVSLTKEMFKEFKEKGQVERGVLLGIAQKVRDTGIGSLTKNESSIYRAKDFVINAIIQENDKLEKAITLQNEKKSTKEKVIPLTTELYEKFVDTGTIERGVLLGIAEKIKAGDTAALTPQEMAIYTSKSSIIEKMLQQKKAATAPAPVNLPTGSPAKPVVAPVTPTSSAPKPAISAEQAAALAQEGFTVSDIQKIQELLDGKKNISQLKKEDLLSDKAKELYDEVKDSKAKGNKLQQLISQLQGNTAAAAPSVARKEAGVLDVATSEALWKKYFSYSDTVKTKAVLDQERENTHNPDGSLNENTQQFVNLVNKLVEDGKQEQFENTSTKMTVHNKSVFEKLGIYPSPMSASLTNAYGAILERMHIVEHPEDALPGETVADPLEWKEKGGDSLKAAQEVSDQLIGEIIMADKNTKKKVGDMLRAGNGAQKIKGLLVQKSLSKVQLTELGSLIRLNQKISDLK